MFSIRLLLHHLPIEAPVLDGFRHVLGGDRVPLLQVRDRARDLEDPHVSSRREPKPRHCLFDQRPPRQCFLSWFGRS